MQHYHLAQRTLVNKLGKSFLAASRESVIAA